MATTRKKSAAVQIAEASTRAIQALDQDETEEGEPEGEVEGEGLGSLPPRRYVEVYRLQTDSNEWGWIDRLQPEQVTTQFLGDRHGGGKFRCDEFGPIKTGANKGKFSQQKSKYIVVDASVRATRPKGGVAETNGGTPTAGSDPINKALTDFTLQQMAAFAQNQSTLQQLTLAVVKQITERPERPADSGSDKYLELLTAIVTKQPPAAPDPVPGMLQIVAAMKDNRPREEGGKLSELISAVKEIRDLGGNGPPADKETGWLDVASQFAPAIGKLVERAVTPASPAERRYIPPSAPTPPVPAVTAGAPAPMVEPAPTVPDAMTMDPIAKQLAPYMPLLVQEAEADHDPDTYARFILDRVKPGFYPMLRDYLSQPDILKRLEQWFPAIGTYQQWFTDFIQAGVSILSGDEGTDQGANDEEDEPA